MLATGARRESCLTGGWQQLGLLGQELISTRRKQWPLRDLPPLPGLSPPRPVVRGSSAAPAQLQRECLIQGSGSPLVSYRPSENLSSLGFLPDPCLGFDGFSKLEEGGEKKTFGSLFSREIGPGLLLSTTVIQTLRNAEPLVIESFLSVLDTFWWKLC